MRLIEADTLYKDITSSIDYCEDVLEIIDRQPTAEPKKGKWIEGADTGTKVLECSVCGGRAFAEEYRYSLGTEGMRFCPYCGARMEE